MFTALLLILTAGSPSAARPAGSLHQPVQLAVLPLTGARVDKEELELYAESLATQLGGRGINVVTSKQVATAIGFERQKQLMGCSADGESCLAELANALGVDGLVTGEVAQLEGGVHQVNLKVVDAASAKTLSSFTLRTQGRQGVADSLIWASRQFASDLAVRLNRVLPPPSPSVLAAEESASRPLRSTAWAPAVAGGALVAASATLFLFSYQRAETLRNAQGTLPGSEARKLRDEGAQLQLWSGTAAAGALVAGSVGAAFYFWKVEPKLPGGTKVTSLSAGPSGVAIAGVFP